MKITQYVTSAIKTIAYSLGLAIALIIGSLAISSGYRYATRPHPVKSIVRVTNAEANSGGTGFVTRSNGKNVIVTNDHVCEVESGGMVHITDDNGTPYIKNILKRSYTRDLCVIDGIEAPALNLSKKTPVRFERIDIMGHPLLKPAAPSTGVVTGKMVATFMNEPEADGTCKKGSTKSEIRTFFGVFAVCTKTEDLNSTTALISPGNSGSPVLNSDGEIVGVVNSAGPDNAAMFIPLNYLRDILEE